MVLPGIPVHDLQPQVENFIQYGHFDGRFEAQCLFLEKKEAIKKLLQLRWINSNVSHALTECSMSAIYHSCLAVKYPNN